MGDKVISLEDEKKKYLLRDKVLVESSFTISATENIILNCILQNIQVSRSEECMCRMSASDFYKVLSKTDHKTVKFINECLDKLMGVRYKFWNDEIEGNFNLIAGFTKDKETQQFIIYIPSEVHKRLMEYNNYAPLDLKILTSLKSFYSQRLYELCRLWSRNDEEKVVYFKVEYIRFILGADEVCEQFKYLNQYVKTAIKDIEKKTQMRIKATPIKEGRKAVKFEFRITDGDTKKYSVPKKEIQFNGDEMQEELREEFLKEYSMYYDFNDSVVDEIYKKACKKTINKTKVQKIGRNQYEYFKQVFVDEMLAVETDRAFWQEVDGM